MVTAESQEGQKDVLSIMAGIQAVGSLGVFSLKKKKIGTLRNGEKK